jgi:hypothetical protein
MYEHFSNFRQIPPLVTESVDFFFLSVPARYPQAPVYGFKKKVRCNAKADWN